MALDNYTNLQTAIGSWLNRSDLASAIPDFITIAEKQMLRRITKARSEGEMLPRAMLTNNAAFSISSEFVNLPADFLGVLSFTIDANAVQIDYIAPENLAYQKQRRGTSPTSSVPGLYSIVGSQFQFLPAPDTTYTGRLIYWGSFTALSASNATNWILTSHPDVYLYGALTAAAPYLQDDARTAVWGGLFTAAIDDMLKSDPLPNDRSWLRVDSGLLYRNNRISGMDINTGGFI